MFKTAHMIVTLYRSTKIIKRLHKERNFNVKNDGNAMDNIIDKVMSRTQTDDQIIHSVMLEHTIELPLN